MWEELISAIERKNVPEAEKIIMEIATEELDKVDIIGRTALILAASKGLEKTCEILISKMNPEAVNAVCNNGNTALTWAAHGNLQKLLVSIFKITPEIINPDETALYCAVRENREKVCKMLLPRMPPEIIVHCKDITTIKKLLAESQIYSNNLVSFILHNFKNKNYPELKIEDCYKYSLYQENKKLIAGIIGTIEDNPKYLIERVDNYIVNNYFTLTGISKMMSNSMSLPADIRKIMIGHMSILPKDCINHIVSFLGSYSLLDINTIDLDIKFNIKESILNKVQKLSSVGCWSLNDVNKAKFCTIDFIKKDNKGAKYYTIDHTLKSNLGILTSDYSNYSIKIAKMMCFEAINLGIKNNNNQDLTCAKEFVKTYPELMNEIISEHPEYFVSKIIAKACIKDIAIQDIVIAQLPLDDHI